MSATVYATLCVVCEHAYMCGFVWVCAHVQEYISNPDWVPLLNL